MDLPAVSIAENMMLGPGVYNIWFVVDYPMDGVLRMQSGAYMMSQVTLIVE